MAKEAKPIGRSLDEFRATHDKSTVIPKKITAAIEKLGPEGWMYELEFIKLCECSPTDFAAFREAFEDFSVNIGGARNPKRAWAGSKALAKKMRDTQ